MIPDYPGANARTQYGVRICVLTTYSSNAYLEGQLLEA